MIKLKQIYKWLILERGLLPVPKFSIYAASPSGHSKCKVFIELQFREQIEPPKLRRKVSVEVIVTKQSGEQ